MRGTTPRILCSILVLLCVAIGTGRAAELKTDVALALESWLTYDDNVFLANRQLADVDQEAQPALMPKDADTFGRLFGNLSVNYALTEGAQELLHGSLTYQYAQRFYAAEHTENNLQDRLLGEVVVPYGEQLALRLFAGGCWDERRSGAAYGLVDSTDDWFGAELQYQPDDRDAFLLGYEYGLRNFAGPQAGQPQTYYDYARNTTWLNYRRKLTDSWAAEAELRWQWRDYEQVARDAEGVIIPGHEREERTPSLKLQLTGSLGEHTALRGGYLYLDNDSTGPYYRYDRERLYALVLQELGPRTSAYVYAHRQWKQYDEQVAYHGPLDAPVPNGVRDDHEWFGLLGAEQKVTDRLSLLVEYSVVADESNDELSGFEDHQYSLGMRWKF